MGSCITFPQIQEISRSFLGLGLNEKYPRVFTRTKRHCSFIQYALNHYQKFSISNSENLDGRLILLDLRD